MPSSRIGQSWTLIDIHILFIPRPVNLMQFIGPILRTDSSPYEQIMSFGFIVLIVEVIADHVLPRVKLDILKPAFINLYFVQA